MLPEAIRLFTAFAGFGIALLTFGLSSNLLYAVPELGVAAYPLAMASGVWAVTVSLGSVLIMRKGRVVAPVVSVTLLSAAAAVLLGSLVYGVWLSTSEQSELDLTVAGAFFLHLMALAAIGHLRQLQGGRSGGVPPAGRLLLALAGSALIVSAIAVPGLAATTAGDFAVPHGSHGSPAADQPEVDRANLDRLDHSGH